MEKRAIKNNTNCCVYGCHSIKHKNPNVHFHYFPPKKTYKVNITNKFGVVEKIDQRKAWENILLLRKPANKHMRVCSKHFVLEDYRCKVGNIPSRATSKISARLKVTAVPSQNLPSIEARRISIAKARLLYNTRKDRLMRRQQQKQLHEVIIEDNITHTHVEEPIDVRVGELTDEEKVAIEGILKLCEDGEMKNFNDKGTQVTSGDFKLDFWRTIQSESTLNSISGITNFKLFNCICDLVDKYYPVKKWHRLKTQDCVLLVFMKLKLVISFRVLAFFFGISQSFPSKIFDKYIQILAQILKAFITWPSIEECRRNIPNCFKPFQSVRVILDCTEIPITQPKCLCCRVKTYSLYKKRNTLKVMTGVSPAGLLTFISKTYGGRSSDKSIFEQSGIINFLEPHIDSVMVDKGFLIEETCTNHFIKMIRPSFLRKKKQFTAEEARFNREISRARVHVERVNQRLRLFKILNAPMAWSLARHADSIMTVCGGMVNLQNPLFAEDKFD